jgi:hypothetical protein
MEPIHGLERLARLMRQRATGKTEKTAATERRAAPAAAAQAARSSPAALERELSAKILQLQQASAQPQVIGRVVVESMLAWEFGPQLHNEPKFAVLVQQVCRHIEDEPELKAAFEQVIRQLTK